MFFPHDDPAFGGQHRDPGPTAASYATGTLFLLFSSVLLAPESGLPTAGLLFVAKVAAGVAFGVGGIVVVSATWYLSRNHESTLNRFFQAANPDDENSEIERAIGSSGNDHPHQR